MFLGYNTNGLAHHDLFDAVDCWPKSAIAAWRSRSTTTPCRQVAGNPPAGKSSGCGDCWNGSACVQSSRPAPVPARSRQSTSRRCFPRPTRRIDFYKYAVDCAAELGSDCVSLWSGALPRADLPPAGDGPAGRRASRSARLRRRAEHSHRFRAGAGNVDRLACGLRGIARPDRRPQLASDARRWPSPLPRRDADRRRDSPLGPAAGERASRGRARGGTST